MVHKKPSLTYYAAVSLQIEPTSLGFDSAVSADRKKSQTAGERSGSFSIGARHRGCDKSKAAAGRRINNPARLAPVKNRR